MAKICRVLTGNCKISKILILLQNPCLFSDPVKPGGKGGLEDLRAKVDLRRNGVGRKCDELFVNTVRNCMKIRILAFEKPGRKYVKNFADGIAVSEKITTFASQ